MKSLLKKNILFRPPFLVFFNKTELCRIVSSMMLTLFLNYAEEASLLCMSDVTLLIALSDGGSKRDGDTK